MAEALWEGHFAYFVKLWVNTVCPVYAFPVSPLHHTKKKKKNPKTKLQTVTVGGDFFISQKSSVRQSRETERGKQLRVEMK